jgi:hypothetical protein
MLVTLAIAVGVLVIGGLLTAGAQAQSNPWCAYFSQGPTNCGFTTFDDCIKAIQGKTGLCDHNAQYLAPAGSNSSSANTRPRRLHRQASQ